MDWNSAIERNREALKRILAMLVAMAAITAGLIPRSPEPKASLEGPCPAISTARSCACSAGRSPPCGGWSSSWRAGWW